MRTVLLLAALAGCSASDAGSDTVTVFAAASLTEVMGEVEEAVERAHPGVDVRVSLAGSQALRLQIAQGAPADVFLSADARHVDALAAKGLISERRVVAHNSLVVITPAADATIETFADLPRAERLVVGAPEVPVGRYTDAVLDAADDAFAEAVRARVVSREANVRLVRAKVQLGEADAAIVYRTDAVGVDGLRLVPIPEALQVRASYHAAAVARDGTSPHARTVLDVLSGPEGQRILAAHGFDGPTP